MKHARPKRVALYREISRAIRVGALAATIGLAASTPAIAQATERADFDIVQQPLPAALKAFAEQSGMQLLYRPEAVDGVIVRPLRGQLDKREALQQLLEGTGLDVVYSTENAATIRPRAKGAVTKEGDTGEWTHLVAAAGPESYASAVDPGEVPNSRPSGDARRMQDLEKVVVTGTRIRGGATPSPVVTIGSEQIRDEGFSDLGQVMQSVSQNFGGGQNPGISPGAEGGGYFNQNTTGGSSVNLRGLGQDATLTLLNGRRMSYGGYDQAVDISAIPVEAVERVEVVTDGASAIYGSDAVGGVVNVVLKRDFDGVAVGVRYGEATDGGLATREYTATGGATWSSGGLVATVRKAVNDPIRSEQRGYARGMFAPSSLYQEADVESGLLSTYQSLGDSVELSLDALRTRRDMQRTVGYATYHVVYPAETTTSLVAPGIAVALPGDWTLEAGVAAGQDESLILMQRVDNLTSATTTTRYRYGNNSRTYEIGAEGPLLAAPGGVARLAVGVGYRHNDFLYQFNGGVSADGEEGSRFAYAELSLPLVSPAQQIGGAHRIELTAAVRGEDYDSYGRVTTPKIGLMYSPTSDLTLKASWGKSFKAPTLYQGYIGQFTYLYPATIFGGAADGTTALYANGGNRDLSPERARTWSASLAFHPRALPGLEAELSAFHIDYTDRIVQPITSVAGLLGSAMHADFIRYAPTATEQVALIGTTQFANFSGVPHNPANTVAIIDNRFVNASVQRTRGLDLSATYRFELAASRLSLRGSVSWLDSERALTATSDRFDAAGVLFYPAKINGRAGAVWAAGALTVSAFGNHRSGVTDPRTGRAGASYTTFDATFRYDTSAGDGPLAGVSFELAAQNLLDRAPPLYTVTSATNAPYDSTNYGAIGRFLSVSLTKRW